jgi:hypothetical protein
MTEKTTVSAQQIIHYVPAKIVQSVSVSQSPIPEPIPPFTAPEFNTLAPEASPIVAPQRHHHMVTWAQIGKLKPKVLFSSQYSIPACFVADLITQ